MPNPARELDRERIRQSRIEAQKYKDEELDEGQAGGGIWDLNLLNYVDVAFDPGVYEIDYSAF